MTLQQYLEQTVSAEQGKRDAWERTAIVLEDEDLSFVRENISIECRLHEDTWDAIFEALFGTPGDEVLVVLTETFQKQTLCGPQIPDTPEPKGRAVDANRFLRWLDDQEIFASPAAQRRYLDDVRTGVEPVVPPREQCHALPLGRHLIWSTFREDEVDPFAGYTDADEVRAYLGLMEPAQPDDQELFLLVYVLPEDVPARYPTVADAYAGDDEWNPEFQCSNPRDPWGYTSGGAPEVVHRVIRGKHLVRSADEDDFSCPPLRTVT